jgi:hypothetical protein
MIPVFYLTSDPILSALLPLKINKNDLPAVQIKVLILFLSYKNSQILSGPSLKKNIILIKYSSLDLNS